MSSIEQKSSYQQIIEPDYSEWAERAVGMYATNAMQRTGFRMKGTPHLVLGLLRFGSSAHILRVEFHLSSIPVEEYVRSMAKILPKNLSEVNELTVGAEEVIQEAHALNFRFPSKDGLLQPEHLLAGLAIVNDESFALLSDRFSIDTGQLLKAVKMSK